jgi:hypothetical protein
VTLTLLLLAAVSAQEVDSSTWDLQDTPGQVRPDDPYWDLELLYHQHRYLEGVEAVKKKLAENPNDVELLWHQVRFMFESGEQVSRTDASMDKEALYEEMAEISRRGLAIDPDHGHLQFALGVSLGRLGTTRGVLASLSMATPIEQTWTACKESDYRYRSIAGEEMLPCDCAHAIGIFYRLVPDSWIVELISGPRGSLQKSLENHEWANQCKADDISMLKELAVTQLCIGQNEDNNDLIIAGRANLLKIGALPASAPSDHTDQRHARQLLLEPKLACGYSRDGQQDLDDAKLQEQAPR